MSWINKILPSGINRAEHEKRRSTVPEGVWTKCIKCDAMLYRPDLERNANVCPKCDHHMRIGARRRLDLFLDKEGREEVFSDIEPIDRLKFRDKKKYIVRLAAAQKNTGERDALVAMRGTLHDIPLVTVAFEFDFHGGSMGQAVGEKFSRAAQLALAEKIPLVCFAASGGARMQEALISLMQMAKTSAVIERLHSEGVPYISVLTDPIYGGVSASLALLGDLNIAEPDARAGFAGPNIIEQTIRQKLPKGFQRSEFLLEHGAIDMIVPRQEIRDTVARVLAKLADIEAIAALADSDDDSVEGDGATTDGSGASAIPVAAAAGAVAAEGAGSVEPPPMGSLVESEAPQPTDEMAGDPALNDAIQRATQGGGITSAPDPSTAEDADDAGSDDGAEEQLAGAVDSETPEGEQADSAAYGEDEPDSDTPAPDGQSTVQGGEAEDSDGGAEERGDNGADDSSETSQHGSSDSDEDSAGVSSSEISGEETDERSEVGALDDGEGDKKLNG